VIHDEVLAIIDSTLRQHGFQTNGSRSAFCRQRVSEIQDRVFFLWDCAGTNSPIYCTANLTVCCSSWQGPCSADESRRWGPSCPSLTWNVGYLLPGRRWHEWEFSSAVDIAPIAAEMGKTIVDVGLPWLERFNDVAEIRQGAQVRRPCGVRSPRRNGVPGDTGRAGLTRVLSAERPISKGGIVPRSHVAHRPPSSKCG
jgi:hypothetical protein